MDDSNLYATIAQVLPLFVLALALERRTLGVREGSDSPTWDAMLGIALLASAAIGEFACFVALAGTANHGTRTTAEVTLGLTGVFLLSDLVGAQLAAYAQHDSKPWERRLVKGLGLVVVTGAALFLAIFAIAAYL